MPTVYENLLRIVDASATRDAKILAMRGFAEELDWTPSYELQASLGVEFAEDHLVVEHGLERSAIITFLKAPARAGGLSATQIRALLSISYNNLVDWHIFVSQTDVRHVYNLAEPSTDPNADRLYPLTVDEVTKRLSATEISRLESERVRRNLPACDEALIGVIKRWKSLLAADYPAAGNTSLSTLFNALIFVRGCEDRLTENGRQPDRPLLTRISQTIGETVNMANLLGASLSATGVQQELGDFLDLQQLEHFAQVDKATAINLCRDFYTPRDASYDFNFAFMSKHALSRIYEQYVALFQNNDLEENKRQLTFVNAPLTEYAPSRTGAVYTPQFIASFFTRYLRENTTPRRFRALRTLDPACGSGIFLRTLLEMQCSPLIPGTTRTTIEQAFLQTEGIDIDANASAATKLSLALLHLVATGTLPVDLPIRTADAISEALEHRVGRYSYGAVLSNPPYIKHEHLGDETRENLKLLLGDDFVGRVDTYLGFVKLALNATEPNGFVCLVLPQVFLQSNNGAPLRMQIAEEFDVRCLVDLSSMPIFEGVGAYSILLIAQRRRVNGIAETKAQVAIVTDFAGAALQACIDGRNVETPFHSVFSVAQEFFQTKQWTLLGPAHLLVSERLSELPRLSDYADVSQGIVTGADDIFIRPLSSIPAKEAAAYVSYLPDRQIARFRLPPRTDMVVFYPFKEKTPLTEEEVQKLYPKTWQYLEDNRAALSNRGPVKNGNTPWWRPERPREPKKVRAPKIVCPHLMLTPRFALDETGQYAVSRAPFIVAKEQVADKQLLRLLSAVLNSSVCNWYLRTYSPKYAKGYSRVEIGLLKSLPVPDLAGFDAAVINRMLGLISRIKDGKNVGPAELELDTIVASLYGFSADERRKLLGIEE